MNAVNGVVVRVPVSGIDRKQSFGLIQRTRNDEKEPIYGEPDPRLRIQGSSILLPHK